MLKDTQASCRTTHTIENYTSIYFSTYGCKHTKMKGIHQTDNKGYLPQRGKSISQREFLLSLSSSNFWSIGLIFQNNIKTKAHIKVSCTIQKSALYTVIPINLSLKKGVISYMQKTHQKIIIYLCKE